MTQQPGHGDPYASGTPAQPYYGQPQQYGQVAPHQPQYQQPMAQPMMVQPVFVPPKPKTNGAAIASMVVALCCVVLSWIIFIPYLNFCILPGEILALILGLVAKKRIKQSGEGGNGMATAGVVISAILLGLSVLAVIVSLLLVAGLFGLAGFSSLGGN